MLQHFESDIQMTNLPQQGQQMDAPWHLDRIDQQNLPLDNTFFYNSNGTGSNVYIVGSGIDATHDEFKCMHGTCKSRVQGFYSASPTAQDLKSDSLIDNLGVGTHAASLVGGLLYGVAKNSSIYSVKIFDDSFQPTQKDLIKSLKFIQKNGVKGGVVLVLLKPYSVNGDEKIVEAVEQLVQGGFTVVVPAGTQDANSCELAPSRSELAITVSGTDVNDKRQPAQENLDQGRANYGPCVDIFAPGFNITGAFLQNSIEKIGGPNTAPSIVAGAAALIVAQHPTASPQQVKKILLESATKDVLSDINMGSPNLLLHIPHGLHIKQFQLQQQLQAPWHLDRIDQQNLPLDNIYNYDQFGTGVNVYMIGSGINYKHQEFKCLKNNNNCESRVKGMFSAVPNVPDAQIDALTDNIGLGTHAASLIGGLQYGVAKNTTIYSLKIVDKNYQSTQSDVISALNEIQKFGQKPGVIFPMIEPFKIDDQEQIISKIDDLVQDGFVVVVPAGTQNQNACMLSPSNSKFAITVSGTDQFDNLSPEEPGFQMANFGKCVDILAPGTNVTGAFIDSDSDFLELSGQNPPPAIVAGVSALYLGQYPEATPQEVKNSIIEMSTKDVLQGLPEGTENRLVRVHYGIVGTEIESIGNIEEIHQLLPQNQQVQEQAPWHLDMIDHHTNDGTYHYKSGNRSTNVYIISSGIKPDHQEFQCQNGECETKVRGFYSTIPNVQDLQMDSLVDNLGLGTHAGSLVGGLEFGVNKNATLYSVKVVDRDYQPTESDYVKALDYIDQNGELPGVVLVLLEPYLADNTTLNNNKFLTKIDRLVQNGYNVIVPAGSTNQDACDLIPSNSKSAITVAGINQSGSIQKSEKNFGATNFGPCVDIYAPGSNITGAYINSNMDIIQLGGPNPAPSIVAGSVAQYLEYNPYATPAEVRQTVIASATSGAVEDIPDEDTTNLVISSDNTINTNQVPKQQTPDQPPDQKEISQPQTPKNNNNNNNNNINKVLKRKFYTLDMQYGANGPVTNAAKTNLFVVTPQNEELNQDQIQIEPSSVQIGEIFQIPQEEKQLFLIQILAPEGFQGKVQVGVKGEENEGEGIVDPLKFEISKVPLLVQTSMYSFA